jgi:RNA polymerase sigma factor (sigma-70 family)
MRTIAVLHSTMRDSEVVAAIVAGDPEGLAEAYDRYASPLYTYCRSLLREPADAADAVQDTFVIAASRLAGLRDRNRLRPWLYAVARNECHRRLRARTVQVTTPLDEMPDVTDTSADVSGEAERDELRTLLRSAVRGLNSGERDLIELQLQQGLDVAEIAAVLGVSRNHTHALLSRARDQLEISLGALLVARSGRQDCAALNMMLADWDGQLNVLMRKRINRHIENCPACTERKKRELAPALLLGLAPLAALPGAVPPGLREQVLRLASSNTPDAAAHRASVAQRTAPFGQHGFPKPLDPPRSSWWRTRSGQAAAAAAAAAVVAAVTLLAVALAASGPGHPGGGAALGPGSGPGTSIAAAGGTPGGPGSGGSGNRPQPTVSANGAANVSPGAGGAPPPGGAPPSGGLATSPGSPGHSGHPSSPASAPPSSSSAKPSSPAPSTSSATATASSSPSRGVLTVTPTTIVLGLNGGTLTLKASFGSVDWSVAESSSLVGQVTVSPTAGTLASGQSATVSVSASSLLGGLHAAALAGDGAGACADCTLTVNPGDITVTVVLDITVGNSSSPPPSSPPASSPPPSSPPPSSPPPSSPPPDAATMSGPAGRLLD